LNYPRFGFTVIFIKLFLPQDAKDAEMFFLKIIKPLRSLRLCGEYIALVENPDTYSTAQLDKFRPPLFEL